MKRALLAAAMVTLLLSNPARAVTGNELQEYCTTRWDLCHGFIVGAAEMFGVQMQHQLPVCMYDGVTYGQIQDVVINYLKAHPESRHEMAVYLVAKAVREAFDCPRAE